MLLFLHFLIRYDSTIIFKYSDKNDTAEVPLLQHLLFSPHLVGERDTKISMLAAMAGHPVGAPARTNT
jgi:hypothetical protein